jgi:Domain of unknown function (DUF4430)
MDTAAKGSTRVWWYAGVTALALAVAFFAVRGCAFMPWNSDKETVAVRLTVTRDFGGEVLRDETIEVREDSSAMQALQEVAEVETSYGGGFIYGVDGMVSGYSGAGSGKTDWFYYINGQMAEVGAGELEVGEGDWLLFDYHSWYYSTFTPAFAGCFPEPFVHGYREPPQECLVLFAPGWEEEGKKLADRLGGAGVPSCRLDELSPEWMPREDEYAIVIGPFYELELNHFLVEANDNAERLGLTAYFDGGELLVLGEEGEAAERLNAGAGLVEAIGPRLGEEGSALMVTGTDTEGVKAALALLIDWDNTRSGPVMVMLAHAAEGGT